MKDSEWMPKFKIGDKVWVRTLYADSTPCIRAGIISGYEITCKVKRYNIIFKNEPIFDENNEDIHEMNILDAILYDTTFFNEQSFTENNIFFNKQDAVSRN